MFGVFPLPVASLLFPDPARTSTLLFILLLAATALLTIGIGSPISMRISAAVASGATLRSNLAAVEPDDPLARKVNFQLTRIVAIHVRGCSCLVRCFGSRFNINAGPLITALKRPASD